VGKPKTTCKRVGRFYQPKFSFLIQKAPFIMKKVKVVLMAITMLTVVGGALAFKAQKFDSALWCTTEFNELDPTNCPIFIDDHGTTGTELIGISSCTDIPGTPCDPTETYLNE
jgi:hypothetical protein